MIKQKERTEEHDLERKKTKEIARDNLSIPQKSVLDSLYINISIGSQRPRQQVILEIAAESDMMKIKQELKEIEAEQYHTETIEVQQELNDRQFREIVEVQDHHNVRIDCKPDIGFIRISGLAKNVVPAGGEIHRIILAWETDKHHTDTVTREVLYFYIRLIFRLYF